MPRGAEYDNGLPQSDNAIETGETKAHGTGSNVTSSSRCPCKPLSPLLDSTKPKLPFLRPLLSSSLPLPPVGITVPAEKANGQLSRPLHQTEELEHTKHTAPLPEGISEMKDHELHSGGGSRGYPAGGSGKGGHDPHPRSGEDKGLGALKAGAKDEFKKVSGS